MNSSASAAVKTSPIRVTTCLSSLASMYPFPSRSKILKASRISTVWSRSGKTRLIFKFYSMTARWEQPGTKMFKQVLRCLNMFYCQDLPCLVKFCSASCVLLSHILPSLVLKVINIQMIQFWIVLTFLTSLV